MNTSRHHLAEVIGKRSLKAGSWDRLAREIAAYLLETGHTADLDSLMRDIMAYRADHGVVEAEAVSANPLSHQDLADIKALLKEEYPQAKEFVIDQRQAPELLGGVKLDMPGEQLDLTVRAKVNKFKRLTISGKGA